eukprot:COSAG02_NODE_20003_length_852_cov_5.653386_2_plen_33_part_01
MAVVGRAVTVCIRRREWVGAGLDAVENPVAVTV